MSDLFTPTDWKLIIRSQKELDQSSEEYNISNSGLTT